MVRSRPLLALSVLAALLLVALPVVAAPPPGPVCEHCAPAYVETANATGVDVRVAESAAVAHLHENGSATWLVGLRLAGPDADRVRENASLHERIARNVTGDRFVGVGRGSLTHVSGDPVAVGEDAVYYRFTDDEFAQAGFGGTLVSTRFREDLDVANYDGLGVDRLTVEAPGMQLTRAPAAASTVDGLSGSAFTVTEVEQAVVTFHPDQASNPVGLLWLELLSAISVAELLFPVVVGNVGIVLLPALVPYALVVGIVLAALGRLQPRDPTPAAKTAVAAVFGVAAAAGVTQPLYASVVALPAIGTEPSPIPVGLGAGAAILAVALWWPDRTGRPLFGGRGPALLRNAETLAVTALLAAGAGGALAGVALSATTAWDGLGLALMVGAPTIAYLPATTAALDGRLARSLGAVVVGFLVGGVAAPVLYTQPQGVVFAGFFFAPFVTGALLAVGWPCFLAGWVLANESATATPGQS